MKKPSATKIIIFLIIVGIVLTLVFIKDYEKNERIPVNEKTGLCPAIEGCELKPSSVPGFCYFVEDC